MDGAAVVSLADYRREHPAGQRPGPPEGHKAPPAWAPAWDRHLTGREVTHRARMLKFLGEQTQRASELNRV